jgi:hypothetical protein
MPHRLACLAAAICGACRFVEQVRPSRSTLRRRSRRSLCGLVGGNFVWALRTRQQSTRDVQTMRRRQQRDGARKACERQQPREGEAPRRCSRGGRMFLCQRPMPDCGQRARRRKAREAMVVVATHCGSRRSTNASQARCGLVDGKLPRPADSSSSRSVTFNPCAGAASAEAAERARAGEDGAVFSRRGTVVVTPADSSGSRIIVDSNDAPALRARMGSLQARAGGAVFSRRAALLLGNNGYLTAQRARLRTASGAWSWSRPTVGRDVQPKPHRLAPQGLGRAETPRATRVVQRRPTVSRLSPTRRRNEREWAHAQARTAEGEGKRGQASHHGG